MYSLRPKPESHKDLGHIGPTGILAFVEVGVKVTIEGAREGSPAAGKVKKGEVIVGVNGRALKGLNPYVVLGKAITQAEATDGTLVFDLESKAGKRQVTIEIPVLGSLRSQLAGRLPEVGQDRRAGFGVLQHLCRRVEGHGHPDRPALPVPAVHR